MARRVGSESYPRTGKSSQLTASRDRYLAPGSAESVNRTLSLFQGLPADHPSPCLHRTIPYRVILPSLLSFLLLCMFPLFLPDGLPSLFPALYPAKSRMSQSHDALPLRPRRLLRGDITYSAAKEQDSNILHELGYRDQKIQYYTHDRPRCV